MGFSAVAHDEFNGDVDQDRLTVLAGLATRNGNTIVNPYLDQKFSVAVVTTDYALATDAPLKPIAGGNARNLDLNRDFVKCDSRNALAFNKLIAQWKPDVFVDTHTSNGADYAATMTLIATQPDKLGGPLGTWLKQVQLPRLYVGMKAAGWPMTPYMNTVGERPEEGIADFMESPRYSTGFTALHHIIGFTTEAHMLKPFADRVAATTDFLQVLLRDISQHGDALLAARAASPALPAPAGAGCAAGAGAATAPAAALQSWQ